VQFPSPRPPHGVLRRAALKEIFPQSA